MMNHLSLEDRAIYTMAFKEFDTNNDGYLDRTELHSTFQSVGYKYTLEEIDEMIGELKHSEDCVDKISLTELLAILTPIALKVKRVAHLRRFFKESDTNKDGFISQEEFERTITAAVEKSGDMLSKTKIQEIMREADVNLDGKIDYEEFLYLVHALYA